MTADDRPPTEGHADHSPESLPEREPERGRAADKPWRIPPKGWLDIFWRLVQAFNGDRVMFVAGGVTFFTLLALFPALGVFVSLYGLFADAATARDHLTFLAGALPPGVIGFLGDHMQRLATRGAGSLGVAFVGSLLLSVWSANASVKSLIYGLNVAYHETEKRNYLHYTLVTLTFTLGGLAFVLFTSGLVVAAPIVAAFLGWTWGGVDLGPLRWPLLFAAYVAMLSVLYRFGPCRQHAQWRWLTFGGVAAALMSLIVSWLFSWYLESVANYDAAYGPLGAAMGFMIWTWWSVMVVLVGAELNAEMEHQTVVDTTTGAPLPLGQRGALVADTVGPRKGAPGFVRFTLDGAMELSRRLLLRQGAGQGAHRRAQEAERQKPKSR